MTRTVSIVGAGIGAAHMAGFAQLADRFRVKNICDLDQDRGMGLASQYDGVGFTADLDAVLADPEIDIVDVCLPPHLHFKVCCDALDAGKIVVCEKPLVASLREADLLQQKANETNGIVAPVFQYRYGLGTAQFHALVKAGLAGKCYAGTFETHWDRPASYYDIDWRGTWKGEQGGAILGHAIHTHDLLSTLLGPIEQVFADVTTRVNDIEVEDCAALSIRMKSGAVVTSSVTLGCAENITRIRLMFEGFTMESDHAPYSPAEKSWHFTAREPFKQSDIDRVLSEVGDVPIGYVGLFGALADALDGSGGNEVTLADGRNSLEFVTAVYASSRSGVPQKLPITESHPLYDSWLP